MNHNIQVTNKTHYNAYDVFYSQFSYKTVSVAIVAIFRVKLFQEYKCTMRLAVSPSLHNT